MTRVWGPCLACFSLPHSYLLCCMYDDYVMNTELDQMSSFGKRWAGGRDGAQMKERRRGHSHPERRMSKETRAQAGHSVFCSVLCLCVGDIERRVMFFLSFSDASITT